MTRGVRTKLPARILTAARRKLPAGHPMATGKHPAKGRNLLLRNLRDEAKRGVCKIVLRNPGKSDGDPGERRCRIVFMDENGRWDSFSPSFYAQGCIRKIVADATCTPRGEQWRRAFPCSNAQGRVRKIVAEATCAPDLFLNGKNVLCKIMGE